MLLRLLQIDLFIFLLFQHDLKQEGSFQKLAFSTLRCFKRAMELDDSNVKLWIEYGSSAYQLHSHASRLLKQVTSSPQTGMVICVVFAFKNPYNVLCGILEIQCSGFYQLLHLTRFTQISSVVVIVTKVAVMSPAVIQNELNVFLSLVWLK